MNRALCQVIGCGPAALGLPVAADRTGELSRLLGEGVRFLDRSPDPMALSRLRFPFLIDANSVGGDFIAGVRRDGVFARTLAGRAGRALRKHHDRQVPLSLVGEFMNDLSRAVEEVLGGFRYGADVRSVHRNTDGSWTSVDRFGSELVTSESVVLATGGLEDTGRIANLYGIAGSRLLGSAELLSGRFHEAAEVLRKGGRISIVGGSHSGFATAELLLRLFGKSVPPGGIALIHRGIALSYESLTEAQSVIPDAAQRLEVCQESGMVNRFHGLRAGPRELCLRTLQGREQRLALYETGSAAARRALSEAGLVVHSAGYRPREVHLYDERGERIPLGGAAGAVDDRCRLVDGELRAVPGVFGLGLGYARSDAWGRRRVGINAFHGEDAERIVSEVLARVAV
ncbi:hypothetical protein ACFT5C_00035 [Streptomyces sp. NPDC057116]|uniref:hypothetical protein n=1 Tax=Streptomyces sp. NPDC057116 TaxID=3346023 RepID=UPI00362F13DB